MFFCTYLYPIQEKEHTNCQSDRNERGADACEYRANCPMCTQHTEEQRDAQYKQRTPTHSEGGRFDLGVEQGWVGSFQVQSTFGVDHAQIQPFTTVRKCTGPRGARWLLLDILLQKRACIAVRRAWYI